MVFHAGPLKRVTAIHWPVAPSPPAYIRFRLKVVRQDIQRTERGDDGVTVWPLQPDGTTSIYTETSRYKVSPYHFPPQNYAFATVYNAGGLPLDEGIPADIGITVTPPSLPNAKGFGVRVVGPRGANPGSGTDPWFNANWRDDGDPLGGTPFDGYKAAPPVIYTRFGSLSGSVNYRNSALPVTRYEVFAEIGAPVEDHEVDLSASGVSYLGATYSLIGSKCSRISIGGPQAYLDAQVLYQRDGSA